MNSADNFVQLFQKSFRVTLGATSALLESLQDTQKREENISKLQTNWSQFAEELVDKGATTEQEARKFVDTLLSQPHTAGGVDPSQAQNSTTVGISDPIPTTAVPVQEPDTQTELRELITQISAMREELTNLRNAG